MKDQGAFTYVREMAPVKEVREAFAKGRVQRHCERSEAIQSLETRG